MGKPVFRHLAAVLCVVGLSAACIPATAQVLFDFEDQTATFITPPMANRPGALTSLVMTKDGVTVTITRDSGIAFDIVSNTGGQAGKPASWGVNSLDPFFDEVTTDSFVADFSVPITAFSIDFGDYGGDRDLVTLTAYDSPGGTGTALGTANDDYDSLFFPSFHSASVTASGIRSVVLTGGSPGAFPNSLFWDNLRVTTAAPQPIVPEPGALAMLCGMGLSSAGLLWRRRRA